jgi:hypothetical protein
MQTHLNFTMGIFIPVLVLVTAASQSSGYAESLLRIPEWDLEMEVSREDADFSIKRVEDTYHVKFKVDGKTTEYDWKPAGLLEASVRSSVQGPEDNYRYTYKLINHPRSARNLQSFDVEAPDAQVCTEHSSKDWVFLPLPPLSWGKYYPSWFNVETPVAPGSESQPLLLDCELYPGFAKCYASGPYHVLELHDDQPSEIDKLIPKNKLEDSAWGYVIAPKYRIKELHPVEHLKSLEEDIRIALAEAWLKEEDAKSLTQILQKISSAVSSEDLAWSARELSRLDDIINTRGSAWSSEPREVLAIQAQLLRRLLKVPEASSN